MILANPANKPSLSVVAVKDLKDAGYSQISKPLTTVVSSPKQSETSSEQPPALTRFHRDETNAPKTGNK
jgi:hypothetical protein